MTITLSPIPVKGNPHFVAEAITDNDVTPNLYNGYINKLDTPVIFPGLTEFFDVGTSDPIDGMYWWESQASLIVVSNGHIFKKTTKDIGSGFADVTGTASDLIHGNKCTFADFDTKLIIANGTSMKVLPDSGGAHDMDAVDPNFPPTSVSFVAAYDSYCVALQDTTGFFFWSNVGDPETWDGEFNNAQTNPDTTNAIRSGWGELILTGTKSFEVWRNDGVTPFVPNRSAYSETGVLAPHSLMLINNVWMMLSDDRQLVFLKGRTPTSLSSTLNQYIQTFTTINDARTSMLQLDGVDYAMVTFPTENKVIIINLKPDPNSREHIWSELANWSGSVFTKWDGQDSVVCSSWNYVVVGDETNGKIYILDLAEKAYDSTGIYMTYRTQWMDREYHGNKRSYGIRAYIKRLDADTGGTFTVSFRFRDNGAGAWGSWIDATVPSGDTTTTELIRVDGPMGMYHSRQWEFRLTGEARVALVRAEELLETSYV